MCVFTQKKENMSYSSDSNIFSVVNNVLSNVWGYVNIKMLLRNITIGLFSPLWSRSELKKKKILL